MVRPIDSDEAAEYLMDSFWFDCDDIDVALQAIKLTPTICPKSLCPTREQVEALQGEWIKHDGYTECSKCEYWYPSGKVEEEDDRTTFCPRCGSPMTDEAVEIVIERLEVLKDGSTD